LSSIPCVTSKARLEGLGRAVHEAFEGALVEVHVALRPRLLHDDLLAPSLLGGEAAVSTTWAGACADDAAALVEALAPRSPRDLLKSRTPRTRTFSPSYLQSCVKTTVRMGTLSHASVSVPLTTLSRPCARAFDEQPVLRQRPAWCRPMP